MSSGQAFICSGWLLSDIVAGWGDGIYEEDEVQEGETYERKIL